MRKRVLVTGGNGFVGREVAGDSMTSTPYASSTTCAVGPSALTASELGKVEFARIDIADAAAVNEVMADIQA